jgi:hypothetical protein
MPEPTAVITADQGTPNDRRLMPRLVHRGAAWWWVKRGAADSAYQRVTGIPGVIAPRRLGTFAFDYLNTRTQDTISRANTRLCSHP